MISSQSEEEFDAEVNTMVNTLSVKDWTEMTTTWPNVIMSEVQIGEVTLALHCVVITYCFQ